MNVLKISISKMANVQIHVLLGNMVMILLKSVKFVIYLARLAQITQKTHVYLANYLIIFRKTIVDRCAKGLFMPTNLIHYSLSVLLVMKFAYYVLDSKIPIV